MTDHTDAALDPGIELELTYDGQQGVRTVTTYVVTHEVTENRLHDDEYDHVLIVAEPDARRPRHVRISLMGAEITDLLAPAEGETWGLVKSLNSKHNTGRRIGTLRGIEATGHYERRYASAAAVKTASVGDVLRFRDGCGVVVDDSYYTTVEMDDGKRRSVGYDAAVGSFSRRHTDDPGGYEREYASVEATDMTMTAPEAARETFDTLQHYGHGDEGKVVAVEIDGERYPVIYRHNAEEEGISLGDERERRLQQDTLELDPLGLLFNGERLDAADLTLIHETDGPEIMTDGGTDTATPELSRAITNASTPETPAEADALTFDPVEPTDEATAAAEFAAPQSLLLRILFDSDNTYSDQSPYGPVESWLTEPAIRRVPTPMFEFPAPQDEDDALAFVVTNFFTNDFDDERAVVETPAPWDTPDERVQANEIIKSLDWEETHYQFDDNRMAWTIDKHALPRLREKALADGYEWTVEAHEPDDETPLHAAVLDRVHAALTDKQTITVTYEQKNGNGRNSRTGEFRANPRRSPNTCRVVFRNHTQGSTYCVKLGDHDEAGLYSGGQYPYMGRVVEISAESVAEDTTI